MRLAWQTLAVALLTGGLSAATSCFSGEGSMGAPCATSRDCGEGQTCTVGVCGRCGDGRVDPGEVCFDITFDVPVGGLVNSLNPVDLDGDGDTDLVAAVNTECRRSVEGPGGGSIVQILDCWKVTLLLARDDERGFDAVIPPDVEAEEGRLEALSLGFFDDNDLVDALIVPDAVAAVIVVLDVGAGVDANSFVVPLAEPARTPLVVDLNGDGRVDLAVAFADLGSVAAALVTEAGTVGDVTVSPAIPNPRLAAADDFTGDGVVDLVAVSAEDGRVAVLRGDGLGAFEALAPVETLEGTTVTGVTSGDLDGDGDLDLVVLDFTRDLATVLRGDGSGGFTVSDALPTGADPVAAVVDDLDGDGVGDLLISNAGEDRVDFWLTRGGEFVNQHEIDVSLNPGVLTREDFDEDGYRDLAIANLNPTMTILYSNP
jgi:hypothetical protein